MRGEEKSRRPLSGRPLYGRKLDGSSPAPDSGGAPAQPPPVSGAAGDSLLLFDSQGVTLLTLGLI